MVVAARRLEMVIAGETVVDRETIRTAMETRKTVLPVKVSNEKTRSPKANGLFI